MGLTEEVKQMQAQGMPEDLIISTLRDKGVSYKEIADVISQSKIKAAIEKPDDIEAPMPYENFEEENTGFSFPSQQQSPRTQSMPGMEQSLMQTSPPAYGQQQYAQQFSYAPDSNQEYYQEQQGISADTIAEISEQIVSEKMSEIRKHLEKTIDFRTTVEARVEHIDDRIKRIEAILDTLQASVLRKIGDYVTNVEDIKREMVETQKTFKKLLPERKEKTKKEHHK